MRCLMKLLAAAAIAALALSHAPAQTPCSGTTLTGIVRDSTLAIIPGASLALDNSISTTSGSDGQFRFSCVSDGQHSLSVSPQDFATQTIAFKTPHPASLDLLL